MKEKILVTGGAGFIGSHIVDRYCQAGYDVTVIDNLSTGKLQNVDKRASFLKADLLNKAAIEKIVEKIKPTVINHHAAQASVTQSLKAPTYDAAVNILGTLNILEAARRHNVKKVIFASTVAVYGNTPKLPLTEDSPRMPINLYGLSKLSAEGYLKLYWHHFKIPYIILRYANVYGPRQRADSEGGVVAVFIDRILKSKPTKIYGHGWQTRDFIYVGDVARINQAVLTLKKPQIINIGTGQQTSVLELHQLIVKAIGSNQKPAFAPVRPGDIIDSYVSTKTIKKILPNYSPTTLKQGILATIEKWQS